MSNLTIFSNPNAVQGSASRGPTALSKALAQNVSMRRIATNTNGTFKRIINGEQVGNAIRGDFNCIIVSALPKVSRTFYAGSYDPQAKATLPDCWSNLGDVPEEEAKNKQSKNCAACPQNIKGSSSNGGRACRYERRIAVLLEGGSTSEVYQFKIPSKSLFGQGSNNTHPFEAYVKFLLANGENPDTVVTNISYDLNADTMALLFTPVRNLTDAEYNLVLEAQANPETERYIQLTVSAASSPALAPPPPPPPPPAAAPAAAAPSVTRFDEPEEEEVAATPIKRAATKSGAAVPPQTENLADIVSAWGSDDEG